MLGDSAQRPTRATNAPLALWSQPPVPSYVKSTSETPVSQTAAGDASGPTSLRTLPSVTSTAARPFGANALGRATVGSVHRTWPVDESRTSTPTPLCQAYRPSLLTIVLSSIGRIGPLELRPNN